MPRRLLREPHLLAHELRTPLGVLAGWSSLINDGDVHPDRTPAQWKTAMRACQDAIARLNVMISETCDEAEALRRAQTGDERYFSELLAITTAAVDQSRRVRAQIEQERQVQSDRPVQRRRTDD